MLPFCSSVDQLNIEYDDGWESDDPPGVQPDDIDPIRWLELFHPFTFVQRLTIPATLEPFIGAALQGLTGDSAAKVFLALENLSIEGSTTDKIAQQDLQSFITARRHSAHTVAVERRSRWFEDN
jgi:hypothetical protein